MQVPAQFTFPSRVPVDSRGRGRSGRRPPLLRAARQLPSGLEHDRQSLGRARGGDGDLLGRRAGDRSLAYRGSACPGRTAQALAREVLRYRRGRDPEELGRLPFR